MALGVTLLDPERVDVRGDLVTGRDVVIDVNTVFEGNNCLGDSVSVGANSILVNTSVGDGTRIHPNCHIENAVIGSDCSLGPYARIRPGTRLADDVRIGNFVEIKKSDIRTGSKINHLSYVGDAEVGEQVNVGAGVITCNYDGARKHRTVIGNRVFVGSDTQLGRTGGHRGRSHDRCRIHDYQECPRRHADACAQQAGQHKTLENARKKK